MRRETRKSTLFLFAASMEVVALGPLLVHASLSEEAQHATLREKAELFRRLKLTDLCLFPEARYTRHLSQADLHSAFQDHPFSLENSRQAEGNEPPVDSLSHLMHSVMLHGVEPSTRWLTDFFLPHMVLPPGLGLSLLWPRFLVAGLWVGHGGTLHSMETGMKGHAAVGGVVRGMIFLRLETRNGDLTPSVLFGIVTGSMN